MAWIPQPGDTVVDRSGITYVLDRLIGEGGQGVVYTTEAEGAAVKISTAAGADAKKIEERISHVMRLPVDDLPVALPRDLLADTAGYAMTMLTGMTSVADLTLDIGARFDERAYVMSGGLRKRLAVIEALSDVINRLHARGLVYGDLSAANVLVSAAPHQWRLFLIDMDNLQTADQEPRYIFTPHYAAPEQQHGATMASDRFSLAIIAYSLLTGSNPFYGEALDLLPPDELGNAPFARRAPYIDDPNDDSNRFDHVVTRSLVISPSMMRLLDTTFITGRFEPSSRTGAHALGAAALRARHALARCPSCGWDNYLPASPACASCGDALPGDAIHIDVLRADAWLPHTPCPFAVVESGDIELSARAVGLGCATDTPALRIGADQSGLTATSLHSDIALASDPARSGGSQTTITINRRMMAPIRLSMATTGAAS